MESLDKHIKTRVKLEAFDTKLLTEACKSLIEGISSINGIAKGPIPLPTKKRIYCVLRSPHVDKKSREHFEIRTHKRIIDIYKPTEAAFANLRSLDIAAGVDVEVKNF